MFADEAEAHIFCVVHRSMRSKFATRLVKPILIRDIIILVPTRVLPCRYDRIHYLVPGYFLPEWDNKLG